MLFLHICTPINYLNTALVQVDVYRTLAALAGTTVPIESTVDGVSLEPAFDDPTIVKLAVPAGQIDYTYEKTVAYSQ